MSINDELAVLFILNHKFMLSVQKYKLQLFPHFMFGRFENKSSILNLHLYNLSQPTQFQQSLNHDDLSKVK